MVKTLFDKQFFKSKFTVFGLWMLIAIIGALLKLVGNNYLIYKFSFWHLIQEKNLYSYYPGEYADLHHYGPVFSLIMAPFAILPDWLGMLLWDIALVLFLFWAIRKSGFNWKAQLFIFWFCANELLTGIFMQQINVAIAGMIILSYGFIEKGKEKWAALSIAIGTFIKLFGIVGLAFFFFSKNKKKFTIWLLIWSAICFVLPMLFSSPEYIISTYGDWFESIFAKNDQSLLSTHQNISLLGMIRKIGFCVFMGSHKAFIEYFYSDRSMPISPDCFWLSYSDIWIIATGLVLFFIPYLRINQWKNESFRRMFLASAMMFLCLFSSSSESSGYIIGLTGAAIWFTGKPWKNSHWEIFLMVFAFILTSLSPTDLFPKCLRTNWVWPFALKALPITLIWFTLIWQMIHRSFDVGGQNGAAAGTQTAGAGGGDQDVVLETDAAEVCVRG